MIIIMINPRQLLEYDQVIEMNIDRSASFEEEEDAEEASPEEADDRECKRFLRMTSSSYMSYMQGDDEEHEEQEARMVECVCSSSCSFLFILLYN
jgi:hypothetical protein|tara:strand:- start:356 stop:640 length:285 start_codon:yes stop_codon:yes gene_type:complete